MSEVDVGPWLLERVRRLLMDDDVGLDDNLLQAGGHSMIVVELQAECQRDLGRELDLRLLFEGTLREVAAELGAADA